MQNVHSFPRSGIAIAALASSVLAACGVGNAGPAAPQAPQIPVAAPIVQAVAPTHEYPGRVEAIDRVELRPRVSGYVEEVAFEEGAYVRKGQRLFRIDARPYRARFAEAEAAFALAQADLNLAREEHQRAERLVARNAIAAQELDRRAAALAAADARVAAARASREAAALDLSFTNVAAPISGRIGRAQVTEGNLVSATAGTGTLLAVLVSTESMYVTFDMTDAVAASVVTGAQKLQVRFAAAKGSEAVGHLAFLDNELGPATGTLRARAAFENRDGSLVPGMIGKVTLVLAERNDALLVDEKAIGTNQGQRFVLVVGKEGALEYRPVTLGARIGALRIVDQGLAAGDAIVVNALMRVRPGAVIQPVPVSMERAAAGDYSPLATNVVAAKE